MVAVYLLAAGLRVGYVAATRPDPLTRDFVKGTDMEVFDGIAREVVAGKWLAGTAGDSPLYPCAFLPLLYAVTGGDIDWAAAVQGTFAAVLVVLVFALARRLYGEFAGAAAGVSVALYASLIIYDTAALGEGLLNVLSAASLLALMAAGDRPTGRRCAGAGVLLGLAAAAKPTTVPFAVFGLVWLAWGLRSRPRRLMRTAAVVAASALATTLPFVVRTKLLSGRCFAVRGNSGIIFLMGNHAGATGGFAYPKGKVGERLRSMVEGEPLERRDAIAYSLAFEFIRSQPLEATKLLWRKCAQFLSAREAGNNLSPRRQRQVTFLRLPMFTGYGLLLPLALLGMVAGGGNRRYRVLVLGYVVIHAAVTVAFIVLARYRLIVVPGLAVFAGGAVAHVARSWRAQQWRTMAGGLALVSAAACGVNWQWLHEQAMPRLHPAGFRDVHGRRVVVRDDTDTGTPFGVELTRPGQIARKTLVLSDEDLRIAADPRLLLRVRATQGAVWSVAVNGRPLPAATPQRGDDGWLSVAIARSRLRRGPNQFDIQLHRGHMRIALDDRIDYDRSGLRAGGLWRRDWLDGHTCARYRALWIASGELKVRLELRGD